MNESSSTIQPVSSSAAIGNVSFPKSKDAGERPVQTGTPPVAPQVSAEKASAIAKDLNEAMRVINTQLSFSVDKATGKMVIKVTDEQTKQVIRQIPPEDMLRISERITELLGVLFDKTK